jgi:hypothetical protein
MLQRLEGGLFNLQQTAGVLAYAAIFDAQHDAYAAAQRCLAAEQVRVVHTAVSALLIGGVVLMCGVRVAVFALQVVLKGSYSHLPL